MAGDRNVVIRLRGEIGDFQAKMLAAGKSVGAVADKMTGAEKESAKFRKGLTEVGDRAGKIGLVAAAGLTAAVGVAAKFDAAMSGVEAATHESADNMDALRQAAIKAGADTAFSASEAADGIEQLAKAGVATADILNGGLQGALDLAAAGTVEVGFAAETAATAMTQFGLSGDKVPHIADLLAAAAGKAQGEVTDMAYALRQSGLVADQMGLTIEETTGALAAFASAGLLGSDAGTSFKTMLMRLVPSTEKASIAMEEIGFSAFDTQGNMKSLTEIAGGLQRGLEDMTVEQRQATLANIFGQDAIRAATLLYEEGAGGIQEWIGAVDDQGYAAETAAIKLDNLKGDLEAFQGSLETLLIGLGEGSQGGLRSLVQGATDATNALSSMPEELQSTVTQMLAVTAITGGGLWFGSKVITGIADTRAALANMSGTAGGASRALAGVSTALKVGVILEGLNLLDAAINETFDQRLDQSNLTRSLDALAQGRVEGEILGQYGEDLTGFADDVELASSKFTAISRLSMKIPFAGDFIAGDTADALRDFEKLDDEFAALVEGGNQEQAQAMFDQLAAAAVAAGHDLSDVSDQFPEYAIALDNAANEARDFGVAQRSTNKVIDDTRGAGSRAASGIEDVRKAARETATDVETLDAALEDLKAQLDVRSQAREYEASLDAVAERLRERADLQKEIAAAEREVANAEDADARSAAVDRLADLRGQLKDFNLTLDISSEAGREWQEALDDIALSAQEAAKGMSGMERTRYLNQARKDFIDLATKITGSKKRARELADELGLVAQKNVKPKVDPQGLDEAIEDTRRWNRMLENLNGKTVKTFIEQTTNRQAGQIERFGGKLYADGGYTGPGAKYDPAGIVHRGEFVFDAATTALYRPLFEAIHRTKRWPGYADGGYVRPVSTQISNSYSTGPSIDYDRLTASILRARPLYGDAHFYDGGDVDREKRRARTAAGGGVNF